MFFFTVLIFLFVFITCQTVNLRSCKELILTCLIISEVLAAAQCVNACVCVLVGKELYQTAAAFSFSFVTNTFLCYVSSSLSASCLLCLPPTPHPPLFALYSTHYFFSLCVSLSQPSSLWIWIFRTLFLSSLTPIFFLLSSSTFFRNLCLYFPLRRVLFLPPPLMLIPSTLPLYPPLCTDDCDTWDMDFLSSLSKCCSSHTHTHTYTQSRCSQSLPQVKLGERSELVAGGKEARKEDENRRWKRVWWQKNITKNKGAQGKSRASQTVKGTHRPVKTIRNKSIGKTK